MIIIEFEIIDCYDIKKLRDKLIDYYGTASSFFPIAYIDLNKVYSMSDKEIIEAAVKLGLIAQNNYHQKD